MLEKVKKLTEMSDDELLLSIQECNQMIKVCKDASLSVCTTEKFILYLKNLAKTHQIAYNGRVRRKDFKVGGRNYDR